MEATDAINVFEMRDAAREALTLFGCATADEVGVDLLFA